MNGSPRRNDTVQFAGTLPTSKREELEAAFAKLAARLSWLGVQGEDAYLWAVVHRDDARAAQEALAAVGFVTAQFAGDHGTVAQQRDGLKQELEAIEQERARMQQEMRERAAVLPRLRILYDLTAQERDRLAAGMAFAQTQTAFLLEGWTPANAQARLEKKLRAVSPECSMEFTEPREGEEAARAATQQPLCQRV